MASVIENQYQPDSVSPPGETLLETIIEMGMAQTELAARTGRPIKTINEIISGKAAITPDTALQLEMVLGVPASFWTYREMQYRDSIARRQEHEQLSQHLEWLNTLPVSVMCERHWIRQYNDMTLQLQELLRFFAVTSPTSWRKIWSGPISAISEATMSEGDIGATTAWLRRGEIQAQSLQCSPYNKRAFMSYLLELSNRSREPLVSIQNELVHTCAGFGVSLVLVDGLPGVMATGATHWLNSQKAIIQLNTSDSECDDHWLRFFHACGHIIKHGKRNLYKEPGNNSELKEQEANQFAKTLLKIDKQAPIKLIYPPHSSHIPV